VIASVAASLLPWAIASRTIAQKLKKIKKRIKKITSLKKSQSITATSIPIGVNAFFMKQQS
jgi:hypothetical protein